MTSPEREELKACAHCGFEKVDALSTGFSPKRFWCRCQGCGMQTPMCVNPDDARGLWNTRKEGKKS